MDASGSITTAFSTFTHVILIWAAATSLSVSLLLVGVRFNRRIRNRLASDRAVYVGLHRTKAVVAIRDTTLLSAVSIRRALHAVRGPQPVSKDRSATTP